MSTELENGRPNIRIEIKNTEERMDVDLDEEEGEIVESHNNVSVPKDTNSESVQTSIFKDFFHKGIEAFNEIDENKLQERAKRFALKPEEINKFGETDLRNLYYSLGITVDNIKDVRFEAIHLRSSNPIEIENVLAYFMDFTPSSIELVDDESCNIVWEDKLFSARTLFNTSQVVKGMPVREATEHVIDSFILDETDSTNKETSLINENRQIEIADDTIEDNMIKLNTEKSVDISEINIPIPPGYWRLGRKSMNSCSVLLRFSLRTDKKPYASEKCSRFYKSANIHHKKREYRGIFSRNREILNEESDKNPWGTLAKNWDEDIKFREKERFIEVPSEESVTHATIPANPELRVRLAAKRRLGNKTEEIEEKLSSEKEQSEESEQENKKKTSKMPRMRMYADEEEEKIKRRKLLQTLKVQSDKLKKTEIPNSDLRNILRMTNKKSRASTQHDQEVDLSYNLKNRNRKMVFTVAQEGSDRIKNRVYQDYREKIRNRVEDRKPISPVRFQRDPSPERIKERESHRDRERRRSPSRRHERKSSSRKFGGRMYSSRGDSDDYEDIQKPKSKVALVIKTQKKPSVASAIQSRNRKFDTSSSSSDSSSEESSSESSEESSSSSSESSDSSDTDRNHSVGRRTKKIPLKVEIENDQYKK